MTGSRRPIAEVALLEKPPLNQHHLGSFTIATMFGGRAGSQLLEDCLALPPKE